MLLPKLLGALGALSLAHVAVAVDSPRYVRRNASADSTSSGDVTDSGSEDSGFTILTDDHSTPPDPHCPPEYSICKDHRARECYTPPTVTVTIPASTVTVTASAYKVTVTVSAPPVCQSSVVLK